MTYAVNQKINSYPQASTGLNSQGLSAQQLQELDGETIRQGIVENPVVKNLSDKGEKNKGLDKILLLPTWLLMILGMERFNTACKGNFEESLIGKVSAWGEKMGKKTPFLDKFGQKADSFKESFMTKIVPKNKILSAIFTTPTQPEFAAAKMIFGGTRVEIAGDACQKLLEKVTENGTVNLDKFGISPSEYKEITENYHKPENIKKLIEIFEKQGKEEFLEKTKVCKIPLSKKLTGETKYLSEVLPWGHKLLDSKWHYSSYVNKLKAFENGNKTFIGKKLPNAMLRVVEGITNGTAGGKGAIFLAAMFIAGSIKDAINAPKGDKASTFAESNVNGIGFYLLIPFCMSIMHGFGGLKYLGMSKEKVEEYRKALAEFNKKATSAAFASKSEYNTARKELQGMLKGDLKGLQKYLFAPLKRAAKIVTVGLEIPKPYSSVAIKETTNFLENFSGKNLSRIFKSEKRYTLQKGLGFLRAPLLMLLIAPPFVNLATKASHLIFGRPAKSILDKEKDHETEQKVPQPVMPEQHAQHQQMTEQLQGKPEMQPSSVIQNAPVQRENLLDMYKANSLNNQAVPVQSENVTNTYKPAPVEQKEILAPQPQEPARTYVPSSKGVKIDPNEAREQDDKLSSAFNKADIAEKVAKQYIHG